jgi:tetratricopeptide (TPR) repeat protein
MQAMTSVADAIAEALNLHRAGRLDEAEALYGRILAAIPDEPNSLNLMGVLRRQQGRREEGLALLERACAVHGDVPEILQNLAAARQELGLHTEAADAWRRLIAQAPGLVDAHMNLGVALRALGRPAEAAEAQRAALALAPERAEVHYNLGNALQDLGVEDEALAAFARAAELRPDWAAPRYNQGTVLHRLNRPREAIAAYEAALALDPGHEGARWNHALAHLVAGDFAAGWRLHECRFGQRHYAPHLKQVEATPWRGETDPARRTILLHAEQGLGDTIQFVRFARDVAARGADVVLEVQPELVRLIARADLAPRVLARGAELPPIDLVCPLMSLPLALGIEAPPATAPYLAADADEVRAWGERLGPARGKRVGLVWSGNPNNTNDARRSIPLDAVAALTAARPDIDWIALYPEPPHILPPNVRPVPGPLADFADTAALAANLDLVISADTSTAHVAGALGLTVWILLPFAPDWRWGLGRSDTAWYPTARLFRQGTAGDWAGVIAEVTGALGR